MEHKGYQTYGPFWGSLNASNEGRGLNSLRIRGLPLKRAGKATTESIDLLRCSRSAEANNPPCAGLGLRWLRGLCWVYST